LKSIFDMF